MTSIVRIPEELVKTPHPLTDIRFSKPNRQLKYVKINLRPNRKQRRENGKRK